MWENHGPVVLSCTMMQMVKHFMISAVNILLLYSVVLMCHALISISLAH